jgi:rubrerythrin
LCAGGVDATVQRAWAGSIAGEIPVDQALPEVWVTDENRHAEALSLLHELRNPPWRHWVCRVCLEQVDGPFEQCWNCGAQRPQP